MARIIVADDDELAILLVRKALEKEGHIIGALNDGSNVCEVASFKQPELLILDCSMPGKSGIDALREVRRSMSSRMPVLVLTGRQSAADEAIAYQAGADDYMRKPFDPEELAVRVQALLENNAAHHSVG